MTAQHNPDEETRLIHGYNRMMERVRASLGKFGQGDRPRLQQAIEKAREEAVRLEELSLEEAERIGNYLRRDIENAASFLVSDEALELKDWFRFDVALIEDRLQEMFLSVADQTRLDSLAFEEALEEAGEYHTGEITGPGTLACLGCGESLHFHNISHIPPCPQCHGTLFTREVG